MTPRIGIIGLGTMGTHHAERIPAAGGAIAGGADVNPAAREEFANRYEVPVYAEHTELLSDVDAVIGTIPNALHEEIAVDALDAGVHVLIEKPLAHTVESAERIASAADGSDAFCTVGFVLRYTDAVQELLSLARDGTFGEIHHVEARYLRRNELPSGGWFVEPELAGGGALVDIGVHVLDLSLAALDYPAIESVYGQIRSESGSLGVEDSASALIRCGSGTTVGLEVAWAADCDPERSLVIRGSDGGAMLDIVAQELRVFEGEEEPEIVPTESRDWLAPESEAFVRAVETGEPPAAGTVESAVSLQRVLDGIYRSAESNSLIEL